jgi:hypothetical protein
MSYAEEAVESLLGIFGDTETYFDQLHNDINAADSEIKDILHELEFMPKMTLWQGFYYAKQMRDNRIKRRKWLDEKNELFFLHQWVTANPQFKNALVRVKTNIKQKQSDNTKRVYHPRIRDDLPTINSMHGIAEEVHHVVPDMPSGDAGVQPHTQQAAD